MPVAVKRIRIYRPAKYGLSYHDQLTGLYNRAYFEAKLHLINNKAEYPITIITTDIDGLKKVNDTRGHNTGDQVLKMCAKIISEALDGAGILARVGGDEFSIILPLTGRDEGERITRQIRYQVFLYNQEHAALPLNLTLGTATAEDKSTSLNELFKQAEDMIFKNKLCH